MGVAEGVAGPGADLDRGSFHLPLDLCLGRGAADVGVHGLAKDSGALLPQISTYVLHPQAMRGPSILGLTSRVVLRVPKVSSLREGRGSGRAELGAGLSEGKACPPSSPTPAMGKVSPQGTEEGAGSLPSRNSPLEREQDPHEEVAAQSIEAEGTWVGLLERP